MTLELWRKSPAVLLRRFRPLFMGVALGATILAIATTSGPAFISATERASVRNELDRATRWTAGLRVSHPASAFGPLPPPGFLGRLGERGGDLVERLAGGVDGVDRMVTTYFGSSSVLASPADSVQVRMIRRSGALRHIDLLRSEGEGLIVPDETARQLGVGLGDVVTLEGARAGAKLRVAGVYRFLPFDRVRPYWAPYEDSIYLQAGADTHPPAFVFASPGSFFGIADRIGDYGDVHWELPLATTDLDVAEARRLSSDLQRVIDRLFGENGFREVVSDDLGIRGTTVSADTALSGVVSSAEERIETVTPAVGLLSLAARAVATTILAALGFYLVKRRRTEVVTLVARGISPTSIGIRAGLECLLPLVIGGLLGAVAGMILVAALGPSPGVDVVRALRSWSTVATALGGGMVVLTTAVAVTTAREERAIAGIEHHRLPRTMVAAVGAVAAAGGAAAYIFYLQPAASTGDPVGLVPTLMPVVLIFAAAVAGAAGAKVVIGWLARRVRRAKVSTYLAIRRLAGAPGMVQVLIAATACAVAVMFYGTAVSASVERTAEAKARVFIGSDVSAQLSANAETTDLPLRETVIARVERATLTNGLDVAVIGIDRETIEDAVHWEDAYADRPLGELVRAIAPGGRRPRVVTVGPVPTDPIIGSARGDVPLDVVGTAHAFPGMNSSDPLLITSRESFDDLLRDVGTAMSSRQSELWAKGDERRVRSVLQRSGVGFFAITSTDAILRTPALQSTLWTLGLLGALGAASGLTAVAGLLLYLQARHRATLISSAMTRRMRLSRRDELRAWLFEVGASVTTAVVLAAVIGLGVAGLMHARLDLRPSLPPQPIMVMPIGALMGGGIAALVLVWLLALRLQREVDASNVAEVLRT